MAAPGGRRAGGRPAAWPGADLPDCVEAVTLDNLTDPAPTAEQDYDLALADEQP
ncbi:MAG: hypothetical protein JWO67_2903 [Streptosporangiaceae bacterium]|nr:hypothetical protein [Streptosporangiaceae bacterium]